MGALKLAAQVGLPIMEFWEITPFELSMIAEGFIEREKARRKEGIFQAYLISRWVWQKKINIKKILQADEKKESMTDGEMLERVKLLNAVFGGETKGIVK